jgi:hypothetical protein
MCRCPTTFRSCTLFIRDKLTCMCRMETRDAAGIQPRYGNYAIHPGGLAMETISHRQ